MTTRPAQMIDRWHKRADPAPGQSTVYWHVLMRDYPQAVELAELAQRRLSRFSGLHMTPLKWLHMTAMIAGPASGFTDNQLEKMSKAAATKLREVPPIRAKLGRVWYHPEAIMLAVKPAHSLTPIRDVARDATRTAMGHSPIYDEHPAWHPHVTICYSIADQEAEPIIAALGEQLPERDITIDTLSLVIQHGPERCWDWSTIATIHLGEDTA